MNILLTGATGFIGRNLVKALIKQHRLVLLTRNKNKARATFAAMANDPNCLIVETLNQIAEQDKPQAVINLAGEAIADKRWTVERKQLLRDSRILFTENLVNWLQQHAPNVKVMISGSAMGFYGSQPAEVLLDEHAQVVDGFTHQLCRDWEQQARRLQSPNCRVCTLRTGLVLGDGGALAKLLPVFRLGLGGPIASGSQMMPWIHIIDMVNAVLFLLDKGDLQGPYNLAAPQAVNNQVFSKTLAKVLHRPAIFRVPAWVIKLLLGEGDELLVRGQNMVPKRLLAEGFSFKYTELVDALAAVVEDTH